MAPGAAAGSAAGAVAVGGGAGTAVAGLVGVAEGTGAAAGAGSGPQPARTSSRIQRDNNVRSLFFMRIFSPVALTAILSVIEPSGLYRSCCILGNCLLCCLRAEGWWDTSTGGSANSLAEAAPRCLSSYQISMSEQLLRSVSMSLASQKSTGCAAGSGTLSVGCDSPSWGISFSKACPFCHPVLPVARKCSSLRTAISHHRAFAQRS